MSALLADLWDALAWNWAREVEHAPAEFQDNAEELRRLEAADAREQLRDCADDADRVRLCKRWLTTYSTTW